MVYLIRFPAVRYWRSLLLIHYNSPHLLQRWIRRNHTLKRQLIFFTLTCSVEEAKTGEASRRGEGEDREGRRRGEREDREGRRRGEGEDREGRRKGEGEDREGIRRGEGEDREGRRGK